MRPESKESLLAWITFLTSSATWLCCTIPIVIIAIGLGTALASWIPYLNWWVKLSEYKFIIFILSGLFLIFTFWFFRISANNCPTDPVLASKCQQIRKWNWRILVFSLILWIIGFMFAYLIPILMGVV